MNNHTTPILVWVSIIFNPILQMVKLGLGRWDMLHAKVWDIVRARIRVEEFPNSKPVTKPPLVSVIVVHAERVTYVLWPRECSKAYDSMDIGIWKAKEYEVLLIKVYFVGDWILQVFFSVLQQVGHNYHPLPQKLVLEWRRIPVPMVVITCNTQNNMGTNGLKQL